MLRLRLRCPRRLGASPKCVLLRRLQRVHAGQGSALQQEIEQLKKMLKAGAEWDVISQMMCVLQPPALGVCSALGAPVALRRKRLGRACLAPT